MSADEVATPEHRWLTARPAGPSWPVRLHTRLWNPHGAAGRVLLLHGLGSDGDVWWWLASRLADHGFMVIAPDLRSHGASPTAVDHRLATLAEDVASLGSGWDLVVGHSLGGAIAADLLARDGSEIASAVLLDPVLRLPDELRVVARQVYGDEAEGLTIAGVAAANPRWSPRDVERKVVASRAITREAVELVIDHNDPWDVVAMAARWRAHVEVLAADPAHGALLDPATIDALPASSRLRVTTLPGVGHGIQREAHAALWETVTRALQEIR